MVRRTPIDASDHWREIPGSPDYEVSRYGQVRRKTVGRGTYPGRLIRARISADGYLRVPISRSKGRTIWVPNHTVVAAAWIGPRPSRRHQVRHLDGDRLNNAASNLAYGTQSENEADKYSHGTDHSGERGTMAKLTEHQARAIKFGTGRTVAELAAMFGVTTATIRAIRAGRRWKHLTETRQCRKNTDQN